jgi:Ubiquitin-conjugating enzyme
VAIVVVYSRIKGSATPVLISLPAFIVIEDHAATGLANRLSVNAIFMVGLRSGDESHSSSSFLLLMARFASMLIDRDLPDVTAQRYTSTCVSHECAVPEILRRGDDRRFTVDKLTHKTSPWVGTTTVPSRFVSIVPLLTVSVPRTGAQQRKESPPPVMSGVARKRLVEERKSWRKDHPIGFWARPQASADGSTDMFRWKAGIPGKEGTDWQGGVFTVSMEFSEEYPARPPRCTSACLCSRKF